MELRLTGEWPPRTLWAEYPNWEPALDEEGLPDQDESTLRPSGNQTEIGEDVAFTAGEAEQSDGLRLPALVELIDGSAVGVTVFTAEADGWSVRELGHPARWVCIVPDWNPEHDRSPSVSFDDLGVFPLLVRSRLALVKTGNPVQFKILPDGTLEKTR